MVEFFHKVHSLIEEEELLSGMVIAKFFIYHVLFIKVMSEDKTELFKIRHLIKSRRIKPVEQDMDLLSVLGNPLVLFPLTLSSRKSNGRAQHNCNEQKSKSFGIWAIGV